MAGVLRSLSGTVQMSHPPGTLARYSTGMNAGPVKAVHLTVAPGWGWGVRER